MTLASSIHSSHAGGLTSLLDARIVLRDTARITACIAIQVGGGVYGEGIITLADDAVISDCSVLLPNTGGQGGGIYGDSGTFVELRDNAKVVNCHVQGAGGCIVAVDIFIADTAYVGHCTALSSLGVSMGGCLVGLSRIVVSDFARVTHCYADDSGAFFYADTVLLTGNAVVSDCTALWSGAVMVAYSNTMVVVQDNATIERTYSGHDGTIFLLEGSSLLMTDQATIHECIADSGSVVYADSASVAFHGQNRIVNCSGDACC